MENASKAVLIAGAILLVMAIIGIGMWVFSLTNTTINDMSNSVTTMSVTAHNSQFENYSGTVTGQQVLECAQKVVSINNNADIDSKFKSLTMYVKEGSSTVLTVNTASFNSTNIKKSRKYTGVVTYNTNGIINSITFTLN